RRRGARIYRGPSCMSSYGFRRCGCWRSRWRCAGHSWEIDMRSGLIVAVSLATLGLGPLPKAQGHDGPPFPIVEQRRFGPYIVSVWTDPDVGPEKGKFFVILKPAPGTELPEELDVKVCVQPKSGRLKEECYDAEKQ